MLKPSVRWIFFIAALAMAGHALGSATVNSVTLNGAAPPVAVVPGATVSVSLNVTTAGTGSNGRWRSTSYQIGAAAAVCIDVPNPNDAETAGTYTRTFNITAPATAGSYDLTFTIFGGDNCGGSLNGSGTFAGSLVVTVPPTVTKTFSPSSVAAGGTSTLTITITNSNAATIDGVAFTDNYPAGLTNSVAAAASQCGGTATGTAGGATLSLANGSIAANSSCTVAATVTATTVGTYTNSTGSVTSNETNAGTSASATLTVTASVSSFNAVDTGGNAVTGTIHTKIAGTAFNLDIVAISGGAQSTTFSGNVKLELLANTGTPGSGYGANNCPTANTVLQTIASAAISGGRSSIAFSAVNNVYRDVRVRISYPTASPTIVNCSTDSFAIRPGSLGFSVTDANRTTAGSTNCLTNTAITGGACTTVHNAGRPFTIAVTAYNADGTTVSSNYDPTSYGGPTALALAVCGGTACTATFGTLTLGTWSASGGVVTTTTASYSDVGAFNLQFQDASFAAVDSSDGSSYIIGSTATGTGRFVPDHFVLSATSITPRSDLAGCSASTFTYMNENMSANFTLTAVNAAGATTALYAGSLARLALNSAASYAFGAIDSAAPTPLSTRVDTSMISTVTATWTAGVATVAAPIAIQRSASPDGPYGSLNIGIAPSELSSPNGDSVALAASALNLDTNNDSILDSAQVGATTAVRFGRLRVLDISGSAKASLPVRMRIEYWNGTAFVVNSLDSCTQIARLNVAMTFQTLGTCATALTTATSTPVTFASGVSLPMLSAPNASGSADLRVNLAVSSGTACNPGSTAATNAGFSYLQGHWTSAGTYTDDPVARATFGIYGQDRLPNNVIFGRENF